ncbi:hypothetical protein [Streptomyces huasconensis]|uniref:hypothetical protein n=1 Tax=Streptomyces huasconensis TaxID=1854574 RepID=UPI00340FB708
MRRTATRDDHPVHHLGTDERDVQDKAQTELPPRPDTVQHGVRVQYEFTPE